MLGAANRPHPRPRPGGSHLFCLFYQAENQAWRPVDGCQVDFAQLPYLRKIPQALR